MNCPHCKYTMGNADLFCPRCGRSPVGKATSNDPANIPTTAAQYGFFGFLGAWIAAHILGVSALGAGCGLPSCGCLLFLLFVAVLMLAGIHH